MKETRFTSRGTQNHINEGNILAIKSKQAQNKRWKKNVQFHHIALSWKITLNTKVHQDVQIHIHLLHLHPQKLKIQKPNIQLIQEKDLKKKNPVENQSNRSKSSVLSVYTSPNHCHIPRTKNPQNPMVQTSIIILKPQISNQTKSTRTDRNAPLNGCNCWITEELLPPKKNEDQPEYNNRGNKN